MTLPFVYSVVYDALLASLQNKPVLQTLPTHITHLQSRWDKIDASVFKSLEKWSGLSFVSPVSCYVVSHLPDIAISRPLTLRYGKDVDRLFYVLIHELAHELISQNKQKVALYIDTMFATMDPAFRHHVPVFLLQERVVTAVFGRAFFLRQQKLDFALPEGTIWHTVAELQPHFQKTLLEFLSHDGLVY